MGTRHSLDMAMKRYLYTLLLNIFSNLSADQKVYSCEHPRDSDYIRGRHVKFGSKISDTLIRNLQNKCGQLCSTESPIRRGKLFGSVATEVCRYGEPTSIFDPLHSV